MRPLSIIIPTFNEAHNIHAILENIAWGDEIIVVDSFSTDETVAIAEQHRVKILQRKYIGPADQKNWAIPQAQHEWVLILDADERVPDALREEIQALLSQPQIPFDGFWIKRQNYFMGKQIKYSGWQGDAVIRLIRKEVCRYNDKQVHEEIETTGIRVGKLQNKMDHYTYKDTKHFLDKMQRYSEWSAKDYFDRTPQVSLFHLVIKPLFRFFKHFVLQQGFRDGKRGLIISAIMAWGVFMRYVHIMEQRNKQP